MVRTTQNFLEDLNLKRESTWKQLYQRYYSPLCCYALKLLNDRELAEDVVQGVCVKIWETDIRFENMASFHGYLYRSVYNNCLKLIRDNKVRSNYMNRCIPKEFDEPESFKAVLEEEIVRKLRRVIDGMPNKRREVILLCLEEKTVEEISDILKISVNTVKKHKKEAYQHIRKVIPADIFVLFYFLFKE